MKNGGRILWNAIAICEVSKTSWQMGEHLMHGDLEDHLKDQSSRLAQCCPGSTNLARKFYLEYYSDIHPASERSDELTPRNWSRNPGIQRIRMTVCEIFQNGWRSSQIISRMQRCLHQHTFLRTQIRSFLRKWHQGSTVFILPSQKTENAKSANEPRLRRLLEEDALAKQYLEQTSLVT